MGLGGLFSFFKRFFVKDYNKALIIGLNIMNAIDGVLEESDNCSGTPVELFPIYIKRGGKKWTINVKITCEREQ